LLADNSITQKVKRVTLVIVAIPCLILTNKDKLPMELKLSKTEEEVYMPGSCLEGLNIICTLDYRKQSLKSAGKELGTVVHAYNPSYSGIRNRRIRTLVQNK
jgi:hypothetical protein